MRALEVYYATGRPISELHRENKKLSLDWFIIGLSCDRQTLYGRIEKRVDFMIGEGLVKETENIMGKFGKDAYALSSIGYRHDANYLSGVWTYEEFVFFLKRDTRRYAKRQLTWFKKNSDIHWFDILDTEGIKGAVGSFYEYRLISLGSQRLEPLYKGPVPVELIDAGGRSLYEKNYAGMEKAFSGFAAFCYRSQREQGFFRTLRKFRHPQHSIDRIVLENFYFFGIRLLLFAFPPLALRPGIPGPGGSSGPLHTGRGVSEYASRLRDDSFLHLGGKAVSALHRIGGKGIQEQLQVKYSR